MVNITYRLTMALTHLIRRPEIDLHTNITTAVTHKPNVVRQAAGKCAMPDQGRQHDNYPQ